MTAGLAKASGNGTGRVTRAVPPTFQRSACGDAKLGHMDKIATAVNAASQYLTDHPDQARYTDMIGKLGLRK